MTGQPKAWGAFLRRVSDTVWTACRRLSRDEDGARAGFAVVAEALRADGFRRLRPYDGSSRLETFIALVARDVLSEQLLRTLQSGGPDGWVIFESFFKADIRRIVARRMVGGDHEAARQDAYQEICLALIADDYRRLKAYKGNGSFTGFVLHTVDRLVLDHIRRSSPRRRAGTTMVTSSRVLPLALEGHDWPSDQPSPEAALLADENERLLSLASNVLREATETLSEVERLYIRVALSGAAPMAARDIARLMRLPVEEIYKLRSRVMARLRTILEKNHAVKRWRASV